MEHHGQLNMVSCETCRQISLVGNAGGLVGGGVVAGVLDAVAVPGALQITCIACMHEGHEGVTTGKVL